jgi:integrase
MAGAHPTVALPLMGAPLERTRHPGIYRRGSRWVVLYRFEGRQHKRSFRTLDQARRFKATVNADIARGEFQPESNMLLRDYATEWIERDAGRRRAMRDSTRADYRSALERFVLPYFGRRRLTQITPRDVNGFVAWLCDEQQQSRRFAPSTIANILNPLRACLRTAVEEGLIRANPTRDVRIPRLERIQDEDDEQARALSREQLRDFLAQVHPRHQLMFKVLALTGLRVSELVALQWRHLQLDGSDPCVRVRRAIVRDQAVPTKSDHSRRNVPLSAELVSSLRAHRSATRWPAPEDPVFASERGTPLRATNLRRRVLKPVAEEVGAPWAGFHTFRHTCASLLFARGANAVQVQHWLGHHSAAFTLATYVHLLTGEQTAALSLREELQGGNEVATQVTSIPDTPEALINAQTA